MLETNRLILKKLTKNDLQNLSSMLKNKDVMQAWEHSFSNKEVLNWFENQQNRYKEYGYGLMAVFLKQTDEFIGQAGITKQKLNGKTVSEIGYLLKKEFWHNGYATECAITLKKFGFNKLNLNEIYSIIRDNNIPSQNVAKRNGMSKKSTIIKHYYNMDMPHFVYCITKDEFKKERN